MIASYAISASYHMLPQHHWRGWLQRLDHAAIYALIAGTFTPLLIYTATTRSYVVLGLVWVLAISAMIYKLWGADVEPKWSLASYLGLGWMGVLALPDLYYMVPTMALIAMFAGGFFYSFGTVFFSRAALRFRYSIWHAFVLFGTSSFFIAIWISLLG